MKSSTEAQSPAADPAIGALSGDPAATIPAQASGLAGWLQEPQERSATGHRAASPMGQISWAVFEWARNPYVLLVTIYLFAPYFSRTVVGDPVRGQAIWGTIAAVAARTHSTLLMRDIDLDRLAQVVGIEVDRPSPML